MKQQIIIEAIKTSEKGINQYLEIMDSFSNVDVSKDKDFQRKYNAFYKVRQRNEVFYKTYYEFMQQKKRENVSFEETLVFLHSKLNRYEPSFSSKLVATHNPDMAIWDVFVLKNIGISAPPYQINNRMKETIDTYNKINEWYMEFMQKQECIQIIELFNEKISRASDISDLKKIDFVLWQIRT